MIDYQKILEYYLDTDYFFKSFFYYFFNTFEHEGDCGIDLKIHFESSVYYEINNRIKKEGGVKLKLPPEIIKKYMCGSYDDWQVFAIIISKWLSMSEEQILLISDKKCKQDCLMYLNYFIINKHSICKTEKQNLVDCRAKDYYLFVDDIRHRAVKTDGYIEDCVTNKQYKITN